MHQTIQDGVGHRRIADLFMPVFHRQLTGDDGGSVAVPFFDDLQNNHELSKLLIDRGADIHVVDVNGTTPLILAAMYGDYDIAKILVERMWTCLPWMHPDTRPSDYVKFSLKTRKRVFQSDDYERNLSFSQIDKESRKLKS